MSTTVTWPLGTTGATATAYTIPAAEELNWSALSAFLIALANGAQATTFQKFAVRKATTTPITAAVTDCIIASKLTVPGAVAVTLPAGVNKQIFMIFDDTKDANTNNITITPDGAETIGGSATLVLSFSGQGVGLAYNAADTDWKVFFNSGLSATLPINKGGTGVTSVTTAPTASAFAGWDANANLSADNLLNGFTTTVTAGGTTTLTVNSTGIQEFTGSSAQTVAFPVVSTLAIGQQFFIINSNSSGSLDLRSSGNNSMGSVSFGTSVLLTCRLITGTTAASWHVRFFRTTLPIGEGGTAVTSVTTTPSINGWAGWNAQSNLVANNFLAEYTATATAAGTTTLVVGSDQQQHFTGTTTQTVVLPVTSTLVLGQSFEIVNRSTGAVTVQSSGANDLQAMVASSTLTATCILTSGTGTASWSWVYSPRISPGLAATSTTAGTVTKEATGSFTATFTNTTGPATDTWYYSLVGNTVTVQIGANTKAFTKTTSSESLKITGVPAGILPTTTVNCSMINVSYNDSGSPTSYVQGCMQATTAGFTMYRSSGQDVFGDTTQNTLIASSFCYVLR